MTDPAPVDPVISLPAESATAQTEPDYQAMYNASKAEHDTVKQQITELTSDRDKYKDLIDRLSGVLNPDSPVDPERLSVELKSREDALRERTVEVAVLRLGGQHAPALLDSRAFMASVASLDPTTPEFETKVKAAASKTTPAQSSGGADLTGGGGNSGKQQLSQADLKEMSPAAIMQAKEDGLLQNLLTGTA
ncbi:MAG: hypothetical protein ACREGD_04935 [Candidatus Saccharimonadales bacterium]